MVIPIKKFDFSLPNAWVQVFPAIRIPELARKHILKRIAERAIKEIDFKSYIKWLNSEPNVPNTKWFKIYPSFIGVGDGNTPTTILMPHMRPVGVNIDDMKDVRYPRIAKLLQASVPYKFPNFEDFITENEIADIWANYEGDEKGEAYFKQQYAETVETLADLNFPLTVWRALSVRDGDISRINFENTGTYWAYQQVGADTYNSINSNNKHKVLLEAQIISPKNVDWEQTLMANMIRPEEFEINVKDGTKLKLKKINDKPAKPKTIIAYVDNPSITAAVNTASEEYPTAGPKVDGLIVGGTVANEDSIESTLLDYEILPGIRQIPLSEFHAKPTELFYAKDDTKRCEALAERIKASGRIDPLIIVLDSEGPYILEGAHRLGALYLLGKKAFPAMVVKDLSGDNEESRAKEAAVKEYSLLIKSAGAKLMYSWVRYPSPKQAQYIDDAVKQGAKLVKSANTLFTNGPKIGEAWGITNNSKEKVQLKELWGTSKKAEDMNQATLKYKMFTGERGMLEGSQIAISNKLFVPGWAANKIFNGFIKNKEFEYNGQIVDADKTAMVIAFYKDEPIAWAMMFDRILHPGSQVWRFTKKQYRDKGLYHQMFQRLKKKYPSLEKPDFKFATPQ